MGWGCFRGPVAMDGGNEGFTIMGWGCNVLGGENGGPGVWGRQGGTIGAGISYAHRILEIDWLVWLVCVGLGMALGSGWGWTFA
jgi:hypothetical protein